MIIACRNVIKKYKTDEKEFFAVNNVSFSVNKGAFIVILGHSGSGKTTLLSLIGGLTKPDSGTVLINGKENWHQSDNDLSGLRSKTIGFVFQFASLIPTLTAIENILLPLSFAEKDFTGRERAREMLAMMDLADKEKTFPGQLSGGQQRRLAIARAFINKPEIILADEPTGDLDEETEADILKLFRKFNSEGTTFIVVTHNSLLAATQNNPQVMFMKNGELYMKDNHKKM